jgi:hypothetical protein
MHSTYHCNTKNILVREKFISRKGTTNENAAFSVTDILSVDINQEGMLQKFSATGPKLLAT